MSNSNSNENLEVIRDFVAEAKDILEVLEPSLMTLEKNVESGDEDREVIHEIFRAFHSIKGAAGFLEFQSIGKLTHEAESLLDLFRKGKAQIEGTHIDLFYQSMDLLQKLIGTVETDLVDNGFEDEVTQLASLLIASMPGAGGVVPNVVEGSQTQEAGFEKILISIGVVGGYLWGIDHITDSAKRRINVEKARAEMQMVRDGLSAMKIDELPEIADNLQALFNKLLDQGNRNLVGILEHLTDGLSKAVIAQSENRPTDQTFILGAVIEELMADEEGEGLADESEVMLGNVLVNLGVINNSALQEALSAQEKPLGEILLDMKAIDRDALDLGLKVQEERKKSSTKPKPGESGVSGNTLRVDLGKLELLGNLVGELVIAENMVTHHESVAGEGFESFRKASNVLNRISREIQDLVMGLRMIPVAGSFQKLTRVVRDVSHKLGKKVIVDVVGEDTEIDKNVIDNLSSPLMHIVRNAVDHGLELPEERLAAGKSETGKVVFHAYQEGGEILIEIRDDGRGIDKERIVAKAEEKGLIAPGTHFSSDEDIYDLLFMPGFSTASQVTDISGRGVGMDVVRKNVQDLQGSISVTSRPGRGSTFILRIPLTLSIIEGMLVRIGSAVLTIPLLSIRESIVVKDQRITHNLDGSEVIKIRDQLVPIVRMGEFMGFRPKYNALEKGILVVVEYGRQYRCLFVDEIIGQRQTVIKKISNFFGDMQGISGFSILSDGDIALVVDVTQIVRLT